MIVALPVSNDNGLKSEISLHFGKTEYFAFVEIKDGKIVKFTIKKNPYTEHGVGDLPRFVKENNADMIIAYGMGERAIDFFNSYGIDVITGVSGKIEDILNSLVNNTLIPDFDWKSKEEFKHHD